MSAFDDAVRQFGRTQSRYGAFGAYDTEPCGVFAQLLERLHAGDVPEIPSTAVGWQLFSDMPGSAEAATALATAAAAVIEAAAGDAVGLAQHVRSWR